MIREVPYITISTDTHAKTSIIQNQIAEKRKEHFPQKKLIPVKEYLTIPFPDFCTIFYEITIWTQYQSQMNEILEKIFYNYDYLDTFVMFTDYDEKKQGKGYKLVGYREGNVTPQDNFDDYSNQERLIKYSYKVRVPTALILDPKDETLAYGRNKGQSKTDNNSKIVYKSQNVIDIKLKEELISAEVMEAVNSPAVTEEERRKFFNALSKTGGSQASTLTFDSSTPSAIATVGSPGVSSHLNHADHVHPHGNLPGGTLHDLVSSTGSGFAPTLSGIVDGYALLKTGSSASWGAIPIGTTVNGYSGSVSLVAGPNISIASSSNGSIAISGTIQPTQVTGSDNFFVNQALTVSGTISNPVGQLILSSTVGSAIYVSGTLKAVNSIISGSSVALTVRATTTGNAVEAYGNNTGAGIKGISDNFTGAPGVWGVGVIGVKGEGSSTGSPGVTGLGAGGGNGGEFTGNANGAGIVAIAGASRTSCCG